jgi:DNA repair exonuclease SbcCD ATPase subunit
MADVTATDVTNAQAATDASAQAANSNAQAATGTGTNSNQNNQQSNTDEREQALKEARNEAKNLRDRLKSIEDKQTESERKRLAEQGEWQKLAETASQERDALKPVQESYQKLSELVTSQIKATIKDWPKEAKDLLPENEPDALKLMSEVERIKPLVAKLTGNAGKSGNVANGKPSSGSTPEDLRNELLAKHGYGTF